nr:hypothetical protein [Tanacetum cinerariifolium]
MRRVEKGYSGVDTPLFKGMIVAQHDDDVAYEGAASVAVDDVPAAVNEPSKPSHTPTTQPPPPSQDLPSTSYVLPTPPPLPIAQPPSPQQHPQPSQPSYDAEILMDILQLYWKHKLLLMLRLKRMQIATITIAATQITTAAITTVPSAARRRKEVVIRDPEKTATPSIIIHSEPKSKDKGKKIMVEEPKPMKKQAQIEQDEAYRKEKEDNDVMRLKLMLLEQSVAVDEDEGK